jgi:hypothetical protein
MKVTTLSNHAAVRCPPPVAPVAQPPVIDRGRQHHRISGTDQVMDFPKPGAVKDRTVVERRQVRLGQTHEHHLVPGVPK